MKYQITINYINCQKTYLAYKKNNTFYYDHNNPIGCSTININNKQLVNYIKINGQVAEW